MPIAIPASRALIPTNCQIPLYAGGFPLSGQTPYPSLSQAAVLYERLA